MNNVEKRKKKKIKLNSDAFPRNVSGVLEDKIYALSEIHERLKYDEIQIDKELIYFKELSKKNLGEIVKLHREWFPVQYTNEFFLNLFNPGTDKIASNIIAIGAFYRIDDKEYILGSILCENKNEKAFLSSTKLEIKKNGICEKLFTNFEYCYIMTIGVIDEYRNLGLGSKLLNEVINTLKKTRINCLAIYLHVIEYNTVAIRFYLKNDFLECNSLRNYYHLNNTYYHGKVFYKSFSDKIKPSKKVKESISGLDEPDSNSNLICSPIILAFIIIFSTIVFCFLLQKLF